MNDSGERNRGDSKQKQEQEQEQEQKQEQEQEQEQETWASQDDENTTRIYLLGLYINDANEQ